MIKLKPCPFCGNDHVVMSYVPINKSYIFHCGGCNMVFIPPKGMAEDEVIALWNASTARMEEAEMRRNENE